ncbi:MAG: CopG family transcriptional regulator [Nitrospira sp.]|nr:CopG family transcriptional regulator [Nitrospira sp.]
MVRTQIYLTADEQDALEALAAVSGTTKSALIREAVDHFLAARAPSTRVALLQSAKGIWRDRDLADFDTLRQELNRVPT